MRPSITSASAAFEIGFPQTAQAAAGFLPAMASFLYKVRARPMREGNEVCVLWRTAIHRSDATTVVPNLGIAVPRRCEV